MSGAGSLCGKRRQERLRRCAQFSALVPSTAGFERLSPAATVICRSQAGQRHDPALKNPTIWRISGWSILPTRLRH
jgi:hypothetical protein